MNNARTIPDDSEVGVVTYDILSDGTEVPDTVQVFSIEVSRTVNHIPRALLHLRDGSAEKETFAVSEGDLFAPGKKITIKVGRDSKNETIFVGPVVKQRIQAQEGGGTSLLVECRHPAFAMALSRRDRYFTDVTDADAFSTILEEYGLDGGIDGATVQHRELVQYHCWDWDYLVTRAEANGLLVLCQEEKVKIAPPKISGSPELQLAFGGNLLSFEAELDARHQWPEVKATAWDAAGQTFFKATTSSVDFQEAGNLSGQTLAEVGGLEAYEIRHDGFLDETELQSWSDATLLRSRLAKLRGRARYVGTYLLQPGMVVELQGLGDRFNGLVYVTGVNYELRNGNCFVDVQFGLDPEWFHQRFDTAAPDAAGVTPPINGLRIGVVKQLEEDPDGEDRILVYLPMIEEGGDGTWARLASLDAGANRGMVFRPEIGDEVIVGFLNDDPRDAVVLGQLHSSNKPSPIAASDDNHEKGYTSRSEMHFSFDDDQKIITLDTPAGNKIVLSEADTAITLEDQNGNSIVLNADGITIKSAKDIVVEAPTGKIDITATQDLTAKGLNSTVEASAALTAKGGATAELSGGAQATVKAAIVMIN